jgi:hypothetical protein
MDEIFDALDAVRVLTRQNLGQFLLIDTVKRVVANHTADQIFIVLLSKFRNKKRKLQQSL